MATIKLADGRGELYQWDTGRKVVIDDETIKKVHYQNRFYGRTIDVDVLDGTAIIPDQLLQSFAPLVVFAWAGSAEDGYTKIEKTFEVHKRNKPAGYVFTPVDQKTLDDLQKQIGNLGDLTTEAKENLVAAINEAAASGGAGSMDLRVTDDYIQYSNDGGRTWANLIAVADLKGADGAKGDKGDKGDPGSDGATGAPGSPGVPGTAATISVGKVTTGAAGTDANVSNSGTSSAAVFDFTIPQGAKGEKGDKGEQGAPGSPGAPGAAGQNGHSPVVTATKSGKTTTISVDGTAIATVVDGADGAPGKDGSPGANGDKGETGPQGPAGTPGKDGAGMDITGATVGQIAKIASVDASGVPTAWSPVDMPSGGSPDAVLYTAQTLTDAQKKQARENIDAGSDFVITGTVDSDGSVTLDKTFAQINNALQENKLPFVKLTASGVAPTIIPMVTTGPTAVVFAGVTDAVETFITTVCITITSAGNVSFALVGTPAVNSDGTMPQVTMASDPASAMQIATKKYVDDNKTTVPTALKNPNALTIKIGSTTVTYDGSAAKTVEIADGSEVSY